MAIGVQSKRQMSLRSNLPFADFVPVVTAVFPLIAVYNGLGVTPTLIVAGVIAAGCAIRRGKFLLPNQLFIFALAGFLFWGTVSEIWALDSTQALIRAGKLTAISVAGLLVIGSIQQITEVQRRRLAITLTISWFLAVGLLTLEALIHGGIFKQAIVGTFDDHANALASLKSGGAVLLIISWIVFAHLIGTRLRVLALVALVLPGFFLLGIGSNAGVLAWCVGLLAGAFGWLIPRKVSVVLCVIVPIIVLATPLAISSLPRESSLTTYFPPSAMHRFAIWRFTTDRLYERPLLGWGLDSARSLPGGKEIVPWRSWLDRYSSDKSKIRTMVERISKSPPEYLPLHPHNALLQVWLELGLVGVTLLMVVALVVLFLMRRVVRLGVEGAAFTGCIATTGTMAFLSFGAWQSWWISTFWLTGMLAIAIVSNPRPTADSIPSE